MTGDPPEEADYPGARGVYEVDAIGLTELLAQLNRGEDFRGRTIDAPTDFYIGVAVNPTADDLDVELERFERKLEAGAQFAMTQVLFDIAYLDAFLERLGGEIADPAARRRLAAAEPAARAAHPQRGAGDRRAGSRAGRAARRRRRTPPRVGADVARRV